MKKQTLNVMALMTLMFASATFVGCKNYDSDIDQLKVDVAQNKAAIKALQDAMAKGVMVSNVEAVAGGYKLTMTDGSTLTLNHGKDGEKGLQGIQGPAGEKGDPAVAPQMRVNAAKNWEMSIDGGATWVEIKDVDGNAIADAKTFVKDNITVNSDGNVVIGGKITGYAFDVTIPSIIMVPDNCTMVVSALDAGSVMQTATVPTMGYFDKWSVNSIQPAKSGAITLAIVKTALSASQTIGGVAYEAGEAFYTSEGVDVILNPSKINAEAIDFKFVAALAEGELYDMPVALKAVPSKKGISTITTKSAETAVWTINLDGEAAVGDLLLGDASDLALSAQNSYGKGVRTMSDYVFEITLANGATAANPAVLDVQNAYMDGGAVVSAPANVIASTLRVATGDVAKIAVYKEDGTLVETKAGEYEAYNGNFIVRQLPTKTASLDKEFTLTYECIGADGATATNANVKVKFVNSTEAKSEYVVEESLVPTGSDDATEVEILQADLLTALFGENSIAKAEFLAKGVNFAVVANEEATEAGVTLAFEKSSSNIESPANAAAFDKVIVSATQAAFFGGIGAKKEYTLSFEYQLQKVTPSLEKLKIDVKFTLDGSSLVLSSAYDGSPLEIPNTEAGVVIDIADVKVYSDGETTTEITTTGAVASITGISGTDAAKVELVITDDEGTAVYTLKRVGAAPENSGEDDTANIKLKGVDAWGKEFETTAFAVTIKKADA